MAGEEAFAEYVAAVLPRLVEVGTSGAFMWCFADYDPDLWDRPPCDEGGAKHERHFGLVRPDGSLKPHTGAIRAFADSRPMVSAPTKTVSLDVTPDEYYLDPTGRLTPMRVEGSASPDPVPGICGWNAENGRVTVPLSSPAFPWSWAVRVGYLADGDTTATVRLGDAAREVQLREGLGEVYVNLVGGGTEVTLDGLDESVNLCVGESEAAGVPMLMGARAKEMLLLTKAIRGGQADFTEICRVVEDWAGVVVESKSKR